MKDRNCEQCGHCQQVADLKAEVYRLQRVVRGVRGEHVVVNMPDYLRYDPDKCAAWWKRYDAKTQLLCEGKKPTEA